MMKLNSIFTSNMVLQANKPIRFFGTGKGIAKIEFLGQIAVYQDRNDEGWRSIQKAQERASKRISNVILVKSADVCECDSIHPLTKSLLGKRIAEALGK